MRKRTAEVIARIPMMVGAHTALIVIMVPALTVLIMLMVMERTKVTRRMVMNGVGVEPEDQTRAARRRRTERVSTALARNLTVVKSAWDDIRVLHVTVTRFIMTNRVIFVKVMDFAGFQKVGT